MGRATAERLAEAGVELVITARRKERLEKAAEEISTKYKISVKPIVADSSKAEDRARLLEACPDPDILAITIKPPAPNGDFLKVTPEMWRESIDTALIGPIELMRQYIPHMKNMGWGRIVNIATFSAKNPMVWRLMSGPARSALINYTASVSREIAKHGVTINNYCREYSLQREPTKSWPITRMPLVWSIPQRRSELILEPTTTFQLDLLVTRMIWLQWRHFFAVH